MTIDPQTGAAGPGAPRREQILAETFVLLADTLVEDYDVVDLLDQLVTSCIDLLRVSAAGLLLDDQQGNLAVIATSSEETRLLEIFQIQSNEGPCLDCVQTGAPVVSDNLEADRARWPRFVPAALDAGFRSVTAVPLRLRRQTIGGLNMFQAHADSIPDEDRRLARALADVATIGILHQRAHHHSAQVTGQLHHALNSRVVIEQAKGVLAERNQVDMDTAFAALRNYSRRYNRKLTDVAVAVTGGAVDPAEITPEARPTARTNPPRPGTATDT